MCGADFNNLIYRLIKALQLSLVKNDQTGTELENDQKLQEGVRDKDLLSQLLFESSDGSDDEINEITAGSNAIVSKNNSLRNSKSDTLQQFDVTSDQKEYRFLREVSSCYPLI